MVVSRISQTLKNIFGSRNERILKSYQETVDRTGEFEELMRSLSDDQLRAKTDEFKEKLKNGFQPEDILPEAFAVVREVASRKVNMRHFNVQLIGGHVLYDGKIAEMATGEGKTLVATLSAYMVHLTGRKVHIITVNDYLAKRDAEWMEPVYEALGMSVGAIQSSMDTSGGTRREQYQKDVTYGTNNEFGFDYLRDNMKMSIDDMVQGPLEYCIIDEVDSILIDEARTPLIISGPAFDDVSRYKKADGVAKQLISLQKGYDRVKNKIDSLERKIANTEGELSEAKKEKNKERIEKAEKTFEKLQKEQQAAQDELETKTQYYEVEFDKKAVHLTHEGVGAAQEIAGVGSFFTGSNMEWPHLLEQSLRAHIVFEREKDYVVIDNKVVIVDEFTGRLMEGRQWSDGLHQAVEAKENVEIKEETQTLATITLQNFFKLYDQVAGMTGTAVTEAEEFMSIYGLDVVQIPTNEPCIRDDREDVIYKGSKEKFDAIVENINEVSLQGRPILVGTISIEKSEAISKALKRKHGVDHEVLNAKQHAREAAIVAKAGHQHTDRQGRSRGNVTIATNMAGRGTDIKITDEVKECGGLHIIGTERHEARRIDNQLRGRSGRQGDPGSSQFFLSFDDDLMRIFSPDWTKKALSWIGWQEGDPIYHKRISKGIEKAQKKVEEKNFEIRKSLLEYDEVMDYQRKIFYSRRKEVLKGENLKDIIWEMLERSIEDACNSTLDDKYPENCIIEWAKNNFDVELRSSEVRNLDAEEVESNIKDKTKANVRNEISLSLGEYLEDFQDRSTWNEQGLCKWAMSSFSVQLTPSKVKKMSAGEIEENIAEAACELVDRKDCSQIIEFLKEDFPAKTLRDWAKNKFEIKVNISEIKEKSVEDVIETLKNKVQEKYKQREIEYPVEFAMNMAYGPEGENIYGYEMIADWAKAKYNADISAEEIKDLKPQTLHKRLMELSSSYSNGQLEKEIEEQKANLNREELVDWINKRFDTSLDMDQVEDDGEIRLDVLKNEGRKFLRKELSDLEKYVLLQVYDSVWKDHLYTMDHLKSSIWTRSFAEKDPKIEYKREGFRLFNDMLKTIEQRVTDIVFKVHLEAGAKARSVWNVSQMEHDQVQQFAMAERQRAAAQAPQTDNKVQQITLDSPKVGRNDPCPCGSGKKYKKCCGRPY